MNERLSDTVEMSSVTEHVTDAVTHNGHVIVTAVVVTLRAS